jgi:hypothetical protein
MLKKSFILFSFLFIIFALSGCAKKLPPYHNYAYYYKHPAQAKKVLDFCNKNYPGWEKQTRRMAGYNRFSTCLHAMHALNDIKTEKWFLKNMVLPANP